MEIFVLAVLGAVLFVVIVWRLGQDKATPPSRNRAPYQRDRVLASMMGPEGKDPANIYQNSAGALFPKSDPPVRSIWDD